MFIQLHLRSCFGHVLSIFALVEPLICDQKQNNGSFSLIKKYSRFDSGVLFHIV